MNTVMAENPQMWEGPVVITGRQIRAAKAMLRLSTRDLAVACNVSTSSIVKAEAAEGVPGMHTHTLQRIQTGLEAIGIEFGPDGYSVRLRRQP